MRVWGFDAGLLRDVNAMARGQAAAPFIETLIFLPLRSCLKLSNV
jgi:hypothetical protein